VLQNKKDHELDTPMASLTAYRYRLSGSKTMDSAEPGRRVFETRCCRSTISLPVDGHAVLPGTCLLLG